MPIIKSAIKRTRQQLKRRSHNLQVKRAVHDDIRGVLDAIATGDRGKVAEQLQAAQSELDRAIKKGVLHRNTAARRLSRLSRQASAVTEEKSAKPAAKAAAKKSTSKSTAAKKPAARKAATKKPAPKK